MPLDVMEGPTENGLAIEDLTLSFREAIDAVGGAAVQALAGHSIYEKRLTAQPPASGFDLEPFTVYFYYIRLDTDGRLTVKHYTRKSPVAIPHSSLQQVVQEMVDNVRNGDNVWPSDGRNFTDIEWDRKSYIAFFVDEENWSLRKSGSTQDGVRFVASPTPNHSFFDGVDLQVTVTNRRTGVITQRSAIACVNHMKRNEEGQDLGEESQAFKFEMIFDVQYANLSTAPLIVIFDPDGTNLGPPVSPP